MFDRQIIKTEVYTFDNPLDEMKQVMDWNFERRQLNTFGKCELGYNGYRLYYERLAEERREKAGEFGKTGGRGHKKNPSVQIQPQGFGEYKDDDVSNHLEDDDEETKGKSRDQIAEQLGLDPKTYWYGKEILEKRYDDYLGIEEMLDEKLVIPDGMKSEEVESTIDKIFDFVFTFIPKYDQLIQQLRGPYVNEYGKYTRAKGVQAAYEEIKSWDNLIDTGMFH